MSYNQFSFKMVPSRKPSHHLAHLSPMTEPAEGRIRGSEGQDGGLGTKPASQANHTVACSYTCLEKDMHAWKLDHFVVWWFFCLFLVWAFLCFVVVVLVWLVGFVAVVVVWFGLFF